MDKIKLIERAKFYSDQLLKGIEPISGIRMAQSSPYNTEKMRNYFSFVSDILNEILMNDGIVKLPGNDGFKLERTLLPFKLSTDEKRQVYITDRPVKVGTFINRINYVIDTNKMKKISLTDLNKWLIQNEYVNSHKEKCQINKTVYGVNSKSRSIGILERKITDKKTGQIKTTVLLSKKAQEFILENMDSIR